MLGKEDGEGVVSVVGLENIKYIQKYTGIQYSYLRELHSYPILILEWRCKMVIIARRPHLDQPIPWRMRVKLPYRYFSHGFYLLKSLEYVARE